MNSGHSISGSQSHPSEDKLSEDRSNSFSRIPEFNPCDFGIEQIQSQTFVQPPVNPYFHPNQINPQIDIFGNRLLQQSMQLIQPINSPYYDMLNQLNQINQSNQQNQMNQSNQQYHINQQYHPYQMNPQNSQNQLIQHIQQNQLISKQTNKQPNKQFNFREFHMIPQQESNLSIEQFLQRNYSGHSNHVQFDSNRDISQKQKERLRRTSQDIKFLDHFHVNGVTTFRVFGTTRSVYKITFESNNHSGLKCNCIDFRMNCKSCDMKCKHICFILDRVLKFRNARTMLLPGYEFTQDEMSKIIKFKYEHVLDNDIVIPKVESSITFETTETDVPDEECSICYETMNKGIGNLKCPQCKKIYHKDCMKEWLSVKEKSMSEKNCPICRCDKWKLYKI